MNTMIDVINSRRSVRKWTSEPVSVADMDEILEAAMNAPSAGDERAWQFVVLTDEKVKADYASFNQNVAYIKNAPAAILVCGDTILEKYPGFYTQDCSAAVENILLAVHAKGLGAVWAAVFPTAVDKIRQLLNLPANVMPFAVVPIGHPSGETHAQSRFDRSRIHTNAWQ